MGVREVRRNGRVVERNPKGSNKAWIGYGLNNLFAVLISTGIGLLVKGGVIKSDHFYWKREKSTIQGVKG